MLCKLTLVSGIYLAAALPAVAQEGPSPAEPAGGRIAVTVRSEEAGRQTEQKRLADEERAVQRKAEVLAFAEQQVPQLRSLLTALETKQPKQFRHAILNLARDEERLNKLKQRDSERFELELQQWKNSQRIQIATAKLTLRGESAEGRQEVKELLSTRNELRQKLLQLELKRARERVARVESQLERTVTPNDSELQRQVEQLLAKAKKGGGAKTTAPAGELGQPIKQDR